MTTTGTILRASVRNDGTIELRDQENRLHNDNDLPACVALDGSQAWFRYGQGHRDTGPAFIHANGSAVFFLNGSFVMQDDSGFSLLNPPKPVVLIETLRSLYNVAPTKEVEDAILAIAEKHGHPTHTVCFS